jgi:thymidine phosphorylase
VIGGTLDSLGSEEVVTWEAVAETEGVEVEELDVEVVGSPNTEDRTLETRSGIGSSSAVAVVAAVVADVVTVAGVLGPFVAACGVGITMEGTRSATDGTITGAAALPGWMPLLRYNVDSVPKRPGI